MTLYGSRVPDYHNVNAEGVDMLAPAFPADILDRDFNGDMVPVAQYQGISEVTFIAATIDVPVNAVYDLLVRTGTKKPTYEQVIAKRVELRYIEAQAMIEHDAKLRKKNAV